MTWTFLPFVRGPQRVLNIGSKKDKEYINLSDYLKRNTMFSAASFYKTCLVIHLNWQWWGYKYIEIEVSSQDSIASSYLIVLQAGNAAREFLQWLLFEATFYRKSLHRHLPLLQGDLEICNFWKPNYSNSRNKICTIGSRSEAHTWAPQG